MKVVIWIGTFIVVSILNIILGEITGFKVGYFLIYLLYFSLARFLCEKWESHKIKKENKKNNKNLEVAETLDEPFNQVAFCRKCGEKLNDTGRFCRKCGTEVVIDAEGKYI